MLLLFPVVSSTSNTTALSCAAVGKGELLREPRHKPVDDYLPVRAQHGIIRPRHPDVSNIRGPLRQHLFIRRLDMRMRPDDRADAPVQKPSHRHLFARCLRVQVDENHVRLLSQRFKLALRRRKRAVARVHEHLPQQVQHAHMDAARLADDAAAAGIARRQIRRADDARIVVQNLKDILIVPNMVPHRNDVDAGLKKLLADIERQPSAVRCILPVYDYHVKRMFLP